MRLNHPVITILHYIMGQGSVAQMVLNSSEEKNGNVRVRILFCKKKTCQKLEEDKCTLIG